MRQNAVTERRFPPLRIVEEQLARFVVSDHSGQALAYFYFEDEARRAISVKLLSKDEARRIAATLRSCRKFLMSAFDPKRT